MDIGFRHIQPAANGYKAVAMLETQGKNLSIFAIAHLQPSQHFRKQLIYNRRRQKTRLFCTQISEGEQVLKIRCFDSTALPLAKRRLYDFVQRHCERSCDELSSRLTGVGLFARGGGSHMSIISQDLNGNEKFSSIVCGSRFVILRRLLTRMRYAVYPFLFSERDLESCTAECGRLWEILGVYESIRQNPAYLDGP
jgi:hypothetical protein